MMEIRRGCSADKMPSFVVERGDEPFRRHVAIGAFR
jgi:hypothetical protein